LIGQAETAKLTIYADLKDQATYVSTASIFVHDMDYQGIYNAFEPIGMVRRQVIASLKTIRATLL